MLTLALVIGVLGGACRKQNVVADAPTDAAPEPEAVEQIDAPGVCTAACERLEQCVPELVAELDGTTSDPAVVRERLAGTCSSTCASYQDPRSAHAVRDCTRLDSCTAFWGCVGTAEARPWLAAIAPVGERTCENLCSQASACAIAKVCETEGKAKRKPGKDGKDGADGKTSDGKTEPSEVTVDPACLRDEALRTELDERCLLQCRALPEDSRARTELIGCIDHVSCDGLLRCLDGWSATDYTDASGPTPGINPTCDSFCTRAIVCGAADSEVELDPEQLDELKQTMTSTYVECAVQCEKDLETGDAVRTKFDECTAVETCEQFAACADEV